jgi:hypothetical protein
MEKRTCDACKFYELKEYTRDIGIFRTNLETTHEATCFRFGVIGIKCYEARCKSVLIGLPERGWNKLLEGPCGAEGKYWEAQ